MSKVLVDREEIEAVRNTLKNGGGAVGVLRWAESVLAAQPAEAEGVDLQRLAAEFDAAPDDAEWEPPHPIFQMARDLDRATAALSAVTAERDRLRGTVEAAYNEWHDKTEWVQKTAKAHELGKHRADVLKDRIDQLRAEVEALRNASQLAASDLCKASDWICREVDAGTTSATFWAIRLNENAAQLRAAMAAKEA